MPGDSVAAVVGGADEVGGRARSSAVVRTAAVCAYLLVGAVSVGVLLARPVGGVLGGDVTARFRPIAVLARPWVDEPVEFPPVAVALLEPLGWVAPEATVGVHLLVQGLLLLAVLAVLAVGAGWGATRRWLVWSTPLLPLLLLRIDLPAVLACVAAIVLVRRGAPVASGVAVAVGVLAKLWPGALVLALWRSHRRAAVVALLLVVAGTGVWMLATASDAPVQVLGFRGARGWHVESVVGSFVLLVDGGTPAVESGAWRFGDASATPTVVLGLVALTLAVAVARRVDDVARVTLTAVALGLVAAPLLSPQYASWLLAPLVLVDDLRPSETVAAAAVVLGSAAVVLLLSDVVTGTTTGWTVLLVRNGAVVALAALLTATGLGGRARTSRPRSPVRSVR